MRTLLVTVAIAAMTGTAHAGAAGAVASEEAFIEVLAPDGTREIRTPEGFIRVEADQPADTGIGSFSIMRADAVAAEASLGRAPDVRAGSGPAVARRGIALERGGLIDRAAPEAGPDPCRQQRSRYARQLLRSAGVDVDDPLAFFEGLAGPGAAGGDLLFSGYFLSGVDPVRPLAWDMELRSIARDLAACESRVTMAPPP